MKINMAYYEVAKQAMFDIKGATRDHPEFFKERDWFVKTPIILLEHQDFELAHRINDEYCRRGFKKHQKVERQISFMCQKHMNEKDYHKEDYRYFVSTLGQLICEGKNRNESFETCASIFSRFDMERWDGYDKILDFSSLYHAYDAYVRAEKNFKMKDRQRILFDVLLLGSPTEAIREVVDDPSFQR